MRRGEKRHLRILGECQEWPGPASIVRRKIENSLFFELRKHENPTVASYVYACACSLICCGCAEKRSAWYVLEWIHGGRNLAQEVSCIRHFSAVVKIRDGRLELYLLPVFSDFLGGHANSKTCTCSQKSQPSWCIHSYLYAPHGNFFWSRLELRYTYFAFTSVFLLLSHGGEATVAFFFQCWTLQNCNECTRRASCWCTKQNWLFVRSKLTPHAPDNLRDTVELAAKLSDSKLNHRNNLFEARKTIRLSRLRLPLYGSICGTRSKQEMPN